MIRNKFDQIREYFRSKWNNKKHGSWAEFFQKRHFSFPSSLSEIANRCPNNLQTYFSNYCVICVIILVYCLITSPLLLFGILFYSAINYMIIKRNEQLELFGKTLSRNQQLIAISVAFIPILYFLGLTATFFWLVGACTFTIALHSIFHESMKLSVEQMNSVTVIPNNDGPAATGDKKPTTSSSPSNNGGGTSISSDDDDPQHDKQPAPSPRKKNERVDNN